LIAAHAIGTDAIRTHEHESIYACGTGRPHQTLRALVVHPLKRNASPRRLLYDPNQVHNGVTAFHSRC
jgi:hypothetical protein